MPFTWPSIFLNRFNTTSFIAQAYLPPPRMGGVVILYYFYPRCQVLIWLYITEGTLYTELFPQFIHFQADNLTGRIPPHRNTIDDTRSLNGIPVMCDDDELRFFA